VVYFGVLWLIGVRAGQFRLQPSMKSSAESG
jgi:hypothetical protein